MKKMLILGMALASLFACSKAARDGFAPEGYMFDGKMAMDGESAAGREPGAEPGGAGNGQSAAGRLTAGEWNDLDHWDFWGKLMTSQEQDNHAEYWGFYTNNRIAVHVVDVTGKPVAGAKVTLLRGGNRLGDAGFRIIDGGVFDDLPAFTQGVAGRDYYYYLNSAEGEDVSGLNPRPDLSSTVSMESWGPRMDGTEYYQYYNEAKGIGGHWDEFGSFVRDATPFINRGDWFKSYFKTGLTFTNGIVLSGRLNHFDKFRTKRKWRYYFIWLFISFFKKH